MLVAVGQRKWLRGSSKKAGLLGRHVGIGSVNATSKSQMEFCKFVSYGEKKNLCGSYNLVRQRSREFPVRARVS